MKYLKRFNEATLVNKQGDIDMGDIFPDCLTDYADDTRDDAYDKGKESADLGYSIEECPYEYPELIDAWTTGFLDMKNSTFNEATINQDEKLDVFIYNKTTNKYEKYGEPISSESKDRIEKYYKDHYISVKFEKVGKNRNSF